MTLYSISQVSNITGIPSLTLRAWEKRYSIVSPARNKSGYREYSKEDIRKLKFVNALVKQGHSIGKVASKDIIEIEGMLKQYESYKYLFKDSEIPEIDNKAIDEILSGLLLALKQYRLDIITHELRKIKLNLRPKDLVFKILSPLLGKVGQMVYDQELKISHEHAISSIIRFHVGQYIYSEYETSNEKKSKIALTTMEGELHEFGILLASLLCLEYGHEIIYLGPNLPSEPLLETAKALNIKSIIIGTHFSTRKSSSRSLTDYINNTLFGLKNSQHLIVGGPGKFDKKLIKSKKNFFPMGSLEELDTYLAQL